MTANKLCHIQVAHQHRKDLLILGDTKYGKVRTQLVVRAFCKQLNLKLQAGLPTCTGSRDGIAALLPSNPTR